MHLTLEMMWQLIRERRDLLKQHKAESDQLVDQLCQNQSLIRDIERNLSNLEAEHKQLSEITHTQKTQSACEDRGIANTLSPGLRTVSKDTEKARD